MRTDLNEVSTREFSRIVLSWICLETNGNRSIKTNKYSVRNWPWTSREYLFWNFVKYFCQIFQNQSNERLTNDLQVEQNQTNSYRNQIEILTNDIHEFEKIVNELKEEKNQLVLNNMDGDQDDQRQNLVRQLTQEKVREDFFLFD